MSSTAAQKDMESLSDRQQATHPTVVFYHLLLLVVIVRIRLLISTADGNPCRAPFLPSFAAATALPNVMHSASE